MHKTFTVSQQVSKGSYPDKDGKFVPLLVKEKLTTVSVEQDHPNHDIHEVAALVRVINKYVEAGIPADDIFIEESK